MFAHSANIGLNNEKNCLETLEIQVQIPIWNLLIPAKVSSLNRFLVPDPYWDPASALRGSINLPTTYLSTFPIPLPHSHLQAQHALHSATNEKGQKKDS